MNNTDSFSPKPDIPSPALSTTVVEQVELWHGEINTLQREIQNQEGNPCATCWRVTGKVPLAALLHNPETTTEEVSGLGSAHVAALKKAIARKCDRSPEPGSVEWVVTDAKTIKSLRLSFSPASAEVTADRWITIMPFIKNPRCAQDKPDDRDRLIPRQH